ncbi:DUF3037 domain-containing protein [soil metagenome]
MLERAPFEYVLVRVVPRIERGECVNAGVIVVCRPRRFLAGRVTLDRSRVLALEPGLPVETLNELERQLTLIPRIAVGDRSAGPIATLELGERWHWLSAPSSTMIQPSAVHTGLCADPQQELDGLFAEMVETSRIFEQGR